MSNKTHVLNKNEKVGRKGYLKGLVAGFLGAAAFLKLTDIPKVNAALSGSGADKQITYWTGTETIAGSSDFTWDYNTGQKIFTAGDLKWDDTDKTLSTNNLKWEDADTKRNFIGGYSGNSVTAGVKGATISGGGDSGDENTVTDNYGTIGGGYGNQAGDNSGTTSDNYAATVGGGETNIASRECSTISGGYYNEASGPYSTVGGGDDNTASGDRSTVGGGDTNTASGSNSTVGGGSGNDATGYEATVGGGGNNIASGENSTVGGGHYNTAGGDYSVAAGRKAKIGTSHHGSFLFADNNDFNFNSLGPNEFAVRCTGGARFVTAIGGAGNPTKQVTFGSDWLLTVGGKSKFGGWIIPTMDNKYKLGYSKKRWKEVWAANGTIQTSLSKFKDNIESPTDIDYLSTVPEPIYFNWKDGDDKQRHLGFVGDHLPNVAKEGDGGVYTSSVTAILCGAMKQMDDTVKQLKEDYETTIKQLEKRIEQLEKNN